MSRLLTTGLAAGAPTYRPLGHPEFVAVPDYLATVCTAPEASFPGPSRVWPLEVKHTYMGSINNYVSFPGLLV